MGKGTILSWQPAHTKGASLHVVGNRIADFGATYVLTRKSVPPHFTVFRQHSGDPYFSITDDHKCVLMGNVRKEARLRIEQLLRGNGVKVVHKPGSVNFWWSARRCGNGW